MDIKQKEKRVILITGLFLMALILVFILNLGMSLYLKNKTLKAIQEIKNLEKTKKAYLENRELVKIYASYLNLISKEFNQDGLTLIESYKLKEKRSLEGIKKIFQENKEWKVSFSSPTENQLSLVLEIPKNDLDKFRRLYFQELIFLRTIKLNIESQNGFYKINLIIQ